MPDRAIEEAHLRQARGHIVAGAARIALQCVIIGRLQALGLRTDQAETCLRTMQNTLDIMRAHKELIESMLADPPAGNPPVYHAPARRVRRRGR